MNSLSSRTNRISIPITTFSPGPSGVDSPTAFLNKYLEDDERKASVVAMPGLGKSTIALRIAGEMVRTRRTDFALVLSGAKPLRDQFIRAGVEHGLHMAKSVAGLSVDVHTGICLPTPRLTGSAAVELLDFATQSSLFILVNEAHATGSSVPGVVSQLLDRHPQSRLLALITPGQSYFRQLHDPQAAWRALVDVEYLFESPGLAAPELLLQAVVMTRANTDEGSLIEAVTEPWLEIIKQMLREPGIIYQIRPRKWEEIIAGAYKRAGFDEVILTPASGDRGRDIIATKYGLGSVRVIDQVKAFKPGHLVTANDVRALMGVLHTDGASKGFVTTTSGFSPRLLMDPLIKPLMPARLELVDGMRLVQRLKELIVHKRGI